MPKKAVNSQTEDVQNLVPKTITSVEANSSEQATKPKRGRPPNTNTNDSANNTKNIGKTKTANIEQQEAKERFRRWEAQGRAELSELRLNTANDAEDKLDERLSVVGAVMLYLSTLGARSKATQESYHYGCRRFMDFLYTSDSGEPAQIKILDLPTRVLLNYHQWLISTYGSEAPATISLYVTVARNLFEHLAERELTPQHCQLSKLLSGLKKQKIRASYKTPRVQSDTIDEVARSAYQATDHGAKHPHNHEQLKVADTDSTLMIAPINLAASDAVPSNKPRGKGVRSLGEKQRLELIERRNRAIILMLYTTGMRRGEVAKLNRDDLEGLVSSAALNSQAEAKLKIIITGKGRKERTIFLDKETLSASQEYLELRGKDNHRPLFLQHHSNRNHNPAVQKGENYRIKPQSIWVVVRDFAARLGIKLNPHKFRHNLATTMLNNGAQLSEVQELLGHANPATTKMIYAHYSTLHLREAFDKYRHRASD